MASEKCPPETGRGVTLVGPFRKSKEIHRQPTVTGLAHWAAVLASLTQGACGSEVQNGPAGAGSSGVARATGAQGHRADRPAIVVGNARR